MTPKTVTLGKVPIPSRRMHNFEDAKIQGKTEGKRLKLGGGVDSKKKTTTTGKDTKSSKTGNNVKDGPKMKHTAHRLTK